MSLGAWLRRIFSPALESPEEDAALREEYGSPPGRGPAGERPDVPMAIPGSGGIDPDARPGTPAGAETAGAETGDDETRTDPAA